MASIKDLADFEKNRPAPDFSYLRKKGLRCRVGRNSISIEIGIEVLAQGLEQNPELFNGETGKSLYRVTDPDRFAKEVAAKLNDEDPDTGNSAMALMFDRVMKSVIEDGSEAVVEQ